MNKNNESVVEILYLPFGDCDAIIVHDKNANGEIDHSWGFPSEPPGYTNNWQLTLFSCMPPFEKLKFIRWVSLKNEFVTSFVRFKTQQKDLEKCIRKSEI